MNLIAKVEKATNNPFQNDVCHISVLSNITLDPFLSQLLIQFFSKTAVNANVQIVRFESYLDEVDKIQDSDLLVVLINFEGAVKKQAKKIRGSLKEVNLGCFLIKRRKRKRNMGGILI